MKLYIVRHGDKVSGNYFNLNLRHQDWPLNEEGVLKAQKLCDFFKDKKIEKIYISEYLRTFQTAKFIAESKGLSLIKDKRLNEIDNGLLDSMSDEEIKEKFPDFFKDFFSFSKDVRFPEGETGEEVKKRQDSLLLDLIKENKDSLLITHEGYIRLFMCNLLGMPVYKRNLFKVDMCGIMEAEYDISSRIWKIIRVNHVIL